MSQHDELITLLKSLLTEQFSPKPHYIKAVLGDGLGNVTVPDRPDLSYVRFSRNSVTSFEIFNRAVNPVNDWPVLVGELPWQPGLTQVICTDWMTYEKSGWGDNMGDTSPHAPTHEWPDGSPGSDPVNVYARAIVPGRGYVTTATPTTVYVNQFDYGTGSQWPGLPGVDLSPLMSSMVTGTMRYAGVYVDTATNTLGVVTGASTVYTPALDPPGMAFPINTVPILRARVYGGQAAITEADIRDARQFLGNLTAGGTGGGDFSLAGDSGTPQTISAGDTLTVAGGNGLATVAGATDTVTVNLDIPGLTAEATADDADELIIYDNTASAHRRMTRANLLAGITGLTGEVWLIHGQTVTTHTTIAAAVTAAAAGDTLIIWNGTYTETVTVNKALRIIGMGAGVTYGAGVTTLDITASGVWVVDLQVTNTYSPATSAGITAVKVAASLTGVRLERVVATAGSAGANTSDIYAGCWTLSAIETDDCEFAGSKGTSAIGLRVGSGSETIRPLIRRGKAMGTGGDYSNFGLYNNTASGYGAELRDVWTSGASGTVAADVMALAGTVTLLDPVLVSGTINDNGGGGVIRGWYYNPDGTLNSVAAVDPVGHGHSKLLANDGSPDPAGSMDAAGDWTIVGHQILSGASKAIKGAGSNFPDLGTTTLADKIGNVYLGTAKDIYPFDDSGGLFNRVVNHDIAVSDHFSSFAGWTWAGAPFSGAAPGTFTTTLSKITARDATAATRFFAYLSPPSIPYYTSIRATIGGTARVGIRIDVGNDTTYAEMWLSAGTVTGFYKLSYILDGGAETTLVDGLPGGTWYDMHLYRAGTTAGFYFSCNAARLTITGAAWNNTPTRQGIVFTNLANSLAGTAYIDWFYSGT